MQPNSVPYGNPGDEPSTLGETISDTATQVKDQASNLGRSAAGLIDEHRDATAAGLQKQLRRFMIEPEACLAGRISGVAHGAAEKLSATADYVKNHDVNRMMEDIGTFVKNNPGPAILAAAAIGFLIGRVLSRND